MNSFDWIQSERKQSTKQCTKIGINLYFTLKFIQVSYMW